MLLKVNSITEKNTRFLKDDELVSKGIYEDSNQARDTTIYLLKNGSIFGIWKGRINVIQKTVSTSKFYIQKHRADQTSQLI